MVGPWSYRGAPEKVPVSLESDLKGWYSIRYGRLKAGTWRLEAHGIWLLLMTGLMTIVSTGAT